MSDRSSAGNVPMSREGTDIRMSDEGGGGGGGGASERRSVFFSTTTVPAGVSAAPAPTTTCCEASALVVGKSSKVQSESPQRSSGACMVSFGRFLRVVVVAAAVEVVLLESG